MFDDEEVFQMIKENRKTLIIASIVTVLPILAGVLGLLLLLLALGYNTIHRWSDPSCDYPARCGICWSSC